MNIASRKTAALFVFVLPLVIHAPQLFDVLKGDPALFFSGLGANIGGALLQGSFTIDPNLGFIDEASAVRGIDDLVHGSLPWWNAYEGVGVPLAGEMQASPFFPLMPLLLLPNGLVLLQAVVQSFAALFAFILFDELGLGIAAATVGAIVFAFNGTFAWLSGAWSYPLPALPLLLLGIERAASDRIARSIGGVVIIALSIALAISAGFIEIAYLNCLLAVAWAVVRIGMIPRGLRVRYLLRMCGGASLGMLIASPILVAFGDYLRYGLVGGHDGSAGSAALPTVGLLQATFPYILGPIFRFDAFANLWGGIGGYGGIATSVLAVSALPGRSYRPLRLALAMWIVLTIGATFGVPILQQVFGALPGMKYIAFYRYVDASWEFAVATLIAFALSDARSLTGRQMRRRVVVSALAVFAWVLFALSSNAATLDAQTASNDFTAWAIASLVIGLVLLAAMPAVARFITPSRRLLAFNLIVALESIGYYLIPVLSLPHSGHLELGSVRYLQKHLGLERFYTLGPILPNYGSRYKIASINHNDLPVPKLWVDRIHHRLDPYTPPILFTGTVPGPSDGVPSRADTFVQNVAEFEKVGVRYVVAPPGSKLDGAPVDLPHEATGITAFDLRNGDRLRLELADVPPGHLERLAVLVANHAGRADGAMSVRVCDVGGCHVGEASPLRGAVDNAYFPIAFRDTPLLFGGPTSVEFHYTGGSHVVTLFGFDRSSVTDARVTVNGKRSARKMLALKANYASRIVNGIVSFPGFTGGVRSPGAVLRGTAVSDIGYGTVDAVRLQLDDVRDATRGLVNLRLCVPNACRSGVSRLVGTGTTRFLRVKLDAPLHVGTRTPAIEIGPLHARVRQATIASIALVAYDDIGAQRLRAVYRDAVSEVYRLPTAAPYYTARNCRFTDATRTALRARCATTSRLERLELYMPGWHATVNGAASPVMREDDTFQGVELPAGPSRITFAFTPEFENLAFLAFGIGLAAVLFLNYRSMNPLSNAPEEAS